jgi:hypothetical protein
MSGIGHIDGQAKLGGSASQILVEARERRDTAVEGEGSVFYDTLIDRRVRALRRLMKDKMERPLR